MLGVSDIYLVTSVVIPRIPDVVPTCCVGCPCLSYCRFDVGFYLASEWCEWVRIEIVLLPKVCIRGYIRCDSCASQHVQGVLSLWEKTTL